jgi:alpha-soluble NSF attachment protein
VDDYNKDEFTQAVVDFDSVSKLDPWKTTLLLRIKNDIQADGGEDDLS